MARALNLLVSRRILILLFILILGSFGLGARLIYVQLLQSHFFQSTAMEQRLQTIPVDARRGTIYDRNGVPLVVSISANAVYAIPAEVKEKENTAQTLADILGLDYDFVLERISKFSATEWIKKRVPSDVVKAVIEADLPGIGVVENPERFYPYGSIAPQILGIVGIDNQGLEGLELYYEDYLGGIKGEAIFERDAVGREIKDGLRAYLPGEPGADIVLTLDYYIQQIAQREVEKAALETGSRLAIIIITDPLTGEILASAQYPSFDIMNFSDFPQGNRKNIAVTDTYEPGSTFKAITAAAALDAGVASLNTHFFDPGYTKVSGWTIRCWNRGGHGSQTFIETLENSCNPFYAKLGVDLGGDRFYEYLMDFNFGQKMGVDFPGEAPGRVREPSRNIPLVTWANIGFGQGMTLTPLQLLAGFGTISNQGIYSVPHYVREIHLNDEIFEPTIPEQRQIIPAEIANIAASALRSVIENGSGRRADVPGYDVAGKTGTAQLVEGGRYSHSKTVTSFAGFAPADDPALAGILVLWEPQGAFYGGIIAAPVFGRLVEQIMPYLNINPKDIERKFTLSVPDVTGFEPENALKVLQQHGFQGEIIGEGQRIIGQVPAANAQIEEGTTILIYTDLDYLETYSDLPIPFGV